MYPELLSLYYIGRCPCLQPGAWREKACEWKWMKHITVERRQIERQRKEWQEALSTVSHGKLLGRQSGISVSTVCPAFPPALVAGLLLNLKPKEEGEQCCLILVSVVFFPPHCIVPLYLSTVKYVTQQESSFRQLRQTRLISWCSFQLEIKDTEKKWLSWSALNWVCVHPTFLTKPISIFPDFSCLERILNVCL